MGGFGKGLLLPRGFSSIPLAGIPIGSLGPIHRAAASLCASFLSLAGAVLEAAFGRLAHGGMEPFCVERMDRTGY